MWLSPAQVPKFDSTLEILAPGQGVRGMFGPIGRNGLEEKQHRQWQTAKLSHPALVPRSLVCCQIWVPGQVIATSASSWALGVLLLSRESQCALAIIITQERDCADIFMVIKLLLWAPLRNPTYYGLITEQCTVIIVFTCGSMSMN